MRPAFRKTLLTAHIVVSIGWLASALCVLALAITGLTSADAQMVTSAYRATEVIWRFVILPFSVAALASGVIQAALTPWGLFRHYWVLAKLLLTLVAVVLLLTHTSSLLPALSQTDVPHAGNHGGLTPRTHLVVASGGTVLLLLFTAVLSVFKPWGIVRKGDTQAFERE